MPRYRVHVDYTMEYVVECEDEAEVRLVVDDGAIEEYAEHGSTQLYSGPYVGGIELIPTPAG